MKDISIIVPIYNAEESLNKCIDSLVNQTKKEIEIILVNDGSTDNSEQIIESYTDKRIKYFKNNNQGIGYTRNFGIQKATGKYIMFIDSDDYLKEDACEKLYNYAENKKCDLVICDFYRVVDNKLIKEQMDDMLGNNLKDEPNILLKTNLSPWNKLYKKTLITENDIKFVEDLKYEDAPFVVECLDKATKIGQLKECLNYYVVHDNSETTIRDEKCFDILKIVDLIRLYFKDKYYIKDEVNELIVSILINYNIQQRVQKNKKLGMKFIDESFNYLRKYIPNYKKSNYFKIRNKLKAVIEKNEVLTKIYCSLYRR